ncbi:MAG TPA: AmmeMemoRadiSam system protein B, partial [Candidatus Ratteibacteria bacterium]|nr:AmmeMemoRadiSam system protein B [Candidatus Ratteibacteria bacterium]
MKKFILFFVLIPFLLYSENVRKPNFAGSFYPENTDSLSKMINNFLKNVDNKKIKVEKDKIIGVIAPHAGYIYSGQVAAYSFKTLEDMTNKTFIIIGRSHHAYFKEVIIEDRDFWQTPLGKVEIDKSLFEELYAQKQFHINHNLLDIDHAIEVEIPFLQKVCKNFKIFPILLGDLDNENINKIS